jgi:NAD(P)-dependent dehydrogenase (short-subunit alcohol dehydrogenase family)
MPRRLSGRIALITGAAQGIGRATAVALARRGMLVVLADVNAAGVEETAALIGRAEPPAPAYRAPSPTGPHGLRRRVRRLGQ